MAIEQAPPQANLRDPRRRRHNIRVFLWLCGWGGAAAIALITFAIASQTKTATDRLRLIFASTEPSAVAQMPPRVAQLEVETQVLTEKMRALAVDRDRLAGRIALLESTIDDMTGAIKKQAAATAALALKATTPPTPSAPATTPTPSTPSRPAPAAATPSTTNASTAQSDAAAPSSAEAVPLPPTRIAAAPVSEPEPPASNLNEFGLDLGGAATLDGVRQRWITVKANFGPMLSGMYPLAAHERRPGSTGYRLIVGPLPNSMAAASLCAHFTAARTACRSAKFDGEQIAQH